MYTTLVETLNSETKDDSNELNFLKAIDLVQTQIQRMARNSFLIKGWTLTLVVGSLLLKTTDYQYFLAILPVLAFWVLDSYYLRIERMYREKYKKIINNEETQRDKLFDLNPHNYTSDKTKKVKVFFSPTLLIFYATITILVLVFSLFGYFFF